MVKVNPMNLKTSYGRISGKLQSWFKKIVNVLKTPSSPSNSASGYNFEYRNTHDMQSTKQIPVAIHSSVKYLVSQIDDEIVNYVFMNTTLIKNPIQLFPFWISWRRWS